MTDFSSLKSNSSALFENLNKKINDSKSTSYSDDEGYWKLSMDKAKNGFAVIRFLPASQGEDFPWITYWDHGFESEKGSGKWYIERSLTTLGQADPVSEYNSALWETGLEENKNKARHQKRRVHYVSNIYVVNDPANPDNNGKVFKFRYGKKIYNMITDMIQPSEEEMALDTSLKPQNIFDFWKGNNFKIKSRLYENWVNYDKSEFEDSSAIADNDEEIEKIWNMQYQLQEELDPSKYKTYEVLKERFNKVMNIKSTVSDTDGSIIKDNQVAEQEKVLDEAVAPTDAGDASEMEDDLKFFEQLSSN